MRLAPLAGGDLSFRVVRRIALISTANPGCAHLRQCYAAFPQPDFQFAQPGLAVLLKFPFRTSILKALPQDLSVVRPPSPMFFVCIANTGVTGASGVCVATARVKVE